MPFLLGHIEMKVVGVERNMRTSPEERQGANKAGQVGAQTGSRSVFVASLDGKISARGQNHGFCPQHAKAKTLNGQRTRFLAK